MGSQTQQRKKKSKKELKKKIEELKKELDVSETDSAIEKTKDSKSLVISVSSPQKEKPLGEYELGSLKEVYPWCKNPDNGPWMYSIPQEDKNIESWLIEWADFTLQWLKYNKIHVISIFELIENKPFVFFRDKLKAVKLIVTRLVKQNYCYYINEEETSIRVLWRSLDEWCDVLYNWAFKIGLSDFTMFDILSLQKSDDNFHKLPVDDLKKIFELMVKKRKARWINKNNYHLELII
ncbi:MAG: hypothetical protein ACTSQY_04225 [Candidatus Odinarchaeia archaeon]